VLQFIQQAIRRDFSSIDEILTPPDGQDEGVWKYEHLRWEALYTLLSSLRHCSNTVLVTWTFSHSFVHAFENVGVKSSSLCSKMGYNDDWCIWRLMDAISVPTPNPVFIPLLWLVELLSSLEHFCRTFSLQTWLRIIHIIFLAQTDPSLLLRYFLCRNVILTWKGIQEPNKTLQFNFKLAHYNLQNNYFIQFNQLLV